jgi:hypothetical protein
MQSTNREFLRPGYRRVILTSFISRALRTLDFE